MSEGKRRVILNKVFPNASYMTQLGNLGHEIINLFKEDTGKFYIHLNPNGTYSDKDPVDILNISEAGKGLYQIISKAVNCSVVSGARTIGRKKGEDRYKQQIGHFKYGGEYIEKYFEQNVTMRGDLEKDLFVTFECDGIYEPKESVYIAFEESILPENRPKLYKLGMNWGRRPCRRYINESDDIIKLIEIIDNNDLWKENPIDIKKRVALSASKIIQLVEKKNETKKEDFTLDMLPFSEDEARLITCFVLRQKLSDIIFTLENTKTSKRTDIYDKINNIGYLDYINNYVKNDNLETLEEINAKTSLYSLKDYLVNNRNYKIYHTLDDYLVNQTQLKDLRQFAGANLVLFDKGSHLGYLYRDEFKKQLIKDATGN